MLRLDRNPPSQLWGQHSAKACTAPTQSHTGPAAAAGARARARCSSGPGGLNTGQRSRLARTRFNSCAIARAHVSKCSAWQGMYTILRASLEARSKTRQQLSNASCSFGRALLVMLPPRHVRRPPAYWRRARGVGCCYVARTEQLKNASASLTAAGPYSKLLLDTL